MANLIEIGTAALALQGLLYEAEGELTPELEASLDDILSSGKDALDSAAYVLRRMDADEESLKAEAKRYTERAKSISTQRENLRGRMGFVIDTTFSGKLKTEKTTLWMQSSPDTLQVELSPDVSLLEISADNSEFVKTTLSLDSTAVKNRYLAGDAMPNGITVTPLPGKRSLRMR